MTGVQTCALPISEKQTEETQEPKELTQEEQTAEAQLAEEEKQMQAELEAQKQREKEEMEKQKALAAAMLAAAKLLQSRTELKPVQNFSGNNRMYSKNPKNFR